MNRLGNVCVVGNGTSLIGAGLGSLIDEHDEVVRFHDFTFVPPDTGQKFTIHGRAITEPRTRHEVENHIVIYHETKQHLWKDLLTDEVAVCCIEANWYLQRFGLPAYRGATTGLSVLHYLLDRSESITVVGFSGPAHLHYYGPVPARDLDERGTNKFHSHATEKLYLEDMERQGRIRWIR